MCVCETMLMLFFPCCFIIFITLVCSRKACNRKYGCADVTRLLMEQSPTELLRQKELSHCPRKVLGLFFSSPQFLQYLALYGFMYPFFKALIILQDFSPTFRETDFPTYYSSVECEK